MMFHAGLFLGFQGALSPACLSAPPQNRVKRMHYESITENIKVAVQPTFLDNQSSPTDNHFVWAYTVHIVNLSAQPVRLINRYWRITNANGHTEEVRGPGVVGEQPLISPGESYEYTSGAPLSTPSGIMSGHYEMQSANGGLFRINIPAFSLDSPHQAIHLN
jgi:ApaG protein|tara:strand:- start:1000 stop:1485 length:486 start_codon:yes stop_codon:yes gene_type:complete